MENKKTKSVHDKRVESANNAREILIQKEIDKYEADKQRAKNLKKARKALAQKEVEKVERRDRGKIARAKHAAKVANEKADAAEAVAEAKKKENYKLRKALRRRKFPAGARLQSVVGLFLSVAALVFAIIFACLYAAVTNQWLGEIASANNAYISTQIAYTVFLCLMIACVLGLLTLATPLWGTLKKEYSLTAVAKTSLIVIWVFCAFAFAVFIVDILTVSTIHLSAAGIPLINISEDAKNIMNYIALLSPIVLVIFSGVLYGSVKKSYPII